MNFQDFLNRHPFNYEQRSTLSTLIENPTTACIFSDTSIGDELRWGGPSNAMDALAARTAVTWLTVEQKTEFHRILFDLLIATRLSPKG
jgi:hypothetical protein